MVYKNWLMVKINFTILSDIFSDFARFSPNIFPISTIEILRVGAGALLRGISTSGKCRDEK